ncbi:MAG TPA: CpaF family protein, partial [Verrucomicrobiales bacterium]|nr:CpaF family protein [Verrucomicrobiales bacterium]
MPDDQKTPQGGAAPADSGNVQPKKETVRINLPPKPTAAPTVKIPAPSAIAGAKPGAAPAAAGGGG